MDTLYKDKKIKSFHFFALITAVPIIGVVIIFALGSQHIKNDINFTSHELKGLDIISHIQTTTLNIQKLRGLLNIEIPDKNSLEELKLIKSKISKNLDEITKIITNTQNHITPPHNKNLLNLIDFIKNKPIESLNCEELTQIIDKLINFNKQISYHCNLILEPHLDKYIYVNNIVFLLPELLETNGQIRAAMVSIKNGVLTPLQKEKLTILKHKTQDILNKIEFNRYILKEITKIDDETANQNYQDVKEAELKIINFNEQFEPNGIYNEITKNIDYIINLYNYNFNILNKSLNKELKDYKNYQFYVIFFANVAILFILFINRMFYLKNKEYIDKIEELTVTDGMTTLYNRRYFDEIFENCLRVQQRTKQSISFIIFDIDFFKQYNDTYGHQAGDNAIKTIAITIKESLRRASDKAFRLGGEEFGILCMAMNKEEVIDFANSIREKIENLKIEHKSSYVNRYMTISMGVIYVKEGKIKSTSQIYKFADEALYKAKEGGRNKVIEYHID